MQNHLVFERVEILQFAKFLFWLIWSKFNNLVYFYIMVIYGILTRTYSTFWSQLIRTYKKYIIDHWTMWKINSTKLNLSIRWYLICSLIGQNKTSGTEWGGIASFGHVAWPTSYANVYILSLGPLTQWWC